MTEFQKYIETPKGDRTVADFSGLPVCEGKCVAGEVALFLSSEIRNCR